MPILVSACASWCKCLNGNTQTISTMQTEEKVYVQWHVIPLWQSKTGSMSRTHPSVSASGFLLHGSVERDAILSSLGQDKEGGRGRRETFVKTIPLGPCVYNTCILVQTCSSSKLTYAFFYLLKPVLAVPINIYKHDHPKFWCCIHKLA